MAGDGHRHRTTRRALRRWSPRLTAGLLLAGLLTTAFGGAPAEAHRTGRHIVRISGHMDMTDIDANDDEVCDVPFSSERVLQRTAANPDPTVTMEFVKDCDEVQATVRLVVSLGDTWADTSGFVKATDKTCVTFFCSRSTIDQKPFRAGVAENFFQRSGPVTLENGDGSVTFEFVYSISS
jgi:hypothetical protein